MTDIARLTEKLMRIEALFAGATTPGERDAAAAARARIMERLATLVAEEPPQEFRWTLPDVWSRKLLLALLRRYDLKPYRYRGQRYTTVMVRAPKRFVQQTLVPEYEQLNAELRRYLDEVTESVVAGAVHGDSSDAAEVEEPRQLDGTGRG
ncbi:MAG TPA: hypothetical protein VGQ83_40830 [Polyangia bacterium]|jgi:hypothetical protein